MSDWLDQQMTDDVAWMIADAGTTVSYINKSGVAFVMNALIDANAVEQPSYGYSQKLSGKAHYVTAAQRSFANYVPQKGDEITISGVVYQVEMLLPHDQADVFTMIVLPKAAISPADPDEKEYF